MPLYVSKWQRRDSGDRNAFANAALHVCRAARAQDGVRDARFYWANWDTIAMVVNAEPGKWGPGSGAGPIPDVARAQIALSDQANMTFAETWGEAAAGEQAYKAGTS